MEEIIYIKGKEAVSSTFLLLIAILLFFVPVLLILILRLIKNAFNYFKTTEEVERILENT